MTISGNLRAVYEACKAGAGIGDRVGEGEIEPLMAEIAPDLAPAWYVLGAAPARERTVAGHLIGRRFGIYLPELPERISNWRTGRMQNVLRPMFPGYVFIFTWLSARNYHRIKGVPGALDFLCLGGFGPAPLPDGLIDDIRAVENKHRPLVVPHEGFGRLRKRKRRWRRESVTVDHRIADHEIVAVRTWSAFADGIDRVDDGQRNRLLHEALGLAA